MWAEKKREKAKINSDGFSFVWEWVESKRGKAHPQDESSSFLKPTTHTHAHTHTHLAQERAGKEGGEREERMASLKGSGRKTSKTKAEHMNEANRKRKRERERHRT